MNFICDGVLIVFAVLCIGFSMKRGFIRSSKRIVALILTAVLLSSVQPYMLNMLQSTPASDIIRKAVEKNVSASYKKQALPEDTDTTDIEETQNIISSLGFPKFMKNSMDKVVSGMTEIKNNVMNVIVDSITLMILKLLSLILLFLIVKLLVFLIMKVLEGLFELPGLKTVNRLLGALLGIFNALLLIYIICGAVSLLTPTDKLTVVEETVSQTYLLKYFYENNLLMMLFI